MIRPLRRPFFAVAASLLLTAPGTALADGPSVWFAPGGGVQWIPNELGVETKRPMAGLLFGFSAGPSWAVELRGHATTSDPVNPAGTKLDLAHGEGNLTWFLTSGTVVRPYLTAGLGAIRLSGGSVHENRFAWNGGAGFSIPLASKIALRVDGRDVSYKVPVSSGEKFKHGPEIFGALSVGFGGTPKDTDGDGVPDKVDQCPGTPAGARVDASGCPIDGDKDGVPDGIDRCDGTPAGAKVDATGCPIDTDQDGVFDGIDQCADTPTGAKVDAKGCPLDSDADGVPDGIDKCEATPAGCTVSAAGCPSDADQDGICDGNDKCPDTPASARVDRNGCPIEVSTKETELLETGMIRLQDINFDTGKATIKPDSYRALDEVGDILSRWPQLRIEIAGHTDSNGSDALNQKLSEARAKSVLQYLLENFPEMESSRFTTKGYGETQPIASNTTELGMARNRRVEFRVLNTEALKRETETKKLAPKE